MAVLTHDVLNALLFNSGSTTISVLMTPPRKISTVMFSRSTPGRSKILAACVGFPCEPENPADGFVDVCSFVQLTDNIFERATDSFFN